MGWETRKNRGCYYVRKQRVGNRVISQYIGSGEAALLAAEIDHRDRQQAKMQREKESEEERKLFAALDERNRQLAEYCDQVEAVLIQTLEAAGYHRHKGGPWRKRRIKPSMSPANTERTIVQESDAITDKLDARTDQTTGKTRETAEKHEGSREDA